MHFSDRKMHGGALGDPQSARGERSVEGRYSQRVTTFDVSVFFGFNYFSPLSRESRSVGIESSRAAPDAVCTGAWRKPRTERIFHECLSATNRLPCSRNDVIEPESAFDQHRCRVDHAGQ